MVTYKCIIPYSPCRHALTGLKPVLQLTAVQEHYLSLASWLYMIVSCTMSIINIYVYIYCPNHAKTKVKLTVMFLQQAMIGLLYLVDVHPLWMSSKKNLTPGHN